jgi:AcrR family transcriptional regulator
MATDATSAAEATDAAEPASEVRAPLTRERVLEAAIRLADESGIEAISMRKVGQELGVEAMSLYNHVSNKDDLLTGMVDAVVQQIPPLEPNDDWKARLLERSYAARQVLKQHEWAPRVIETRLEPTPTMMAYMDSVVGVFRDGGFSMDLTHHALHVLGSRPLGFTQELFDDSQPPPENPEVAALMMQQMLAAYPNIAAMVAASEHDDDSILGDGCDDDAEFTFALDLILDGLERLKHQAPSD